MITQLAHKQIAAGADEAEMATVQYETLTFKLNGLKALSYEEAGALTDCVREVSNTFNWTPEQRKNLIVSINNRLRTSGDTGMSSKRQNQECTSWELYPTAVEIETIGNPALSDSAKISCIRLRCKLMGLHCATEGTKGRIGMIMRHLSGRADMPPNDWKILLTKLRNSLADLKKAEWNHSWITSYPIDPNDLPSDVMQAAYGDDAPSMHIIPGLDVPEFLRKNSKFLDKAPALNVTAPDPTADLSKICAMYGNAMAAQMQGPNWGGGSGSNSWHAWGSSGSGGWGSSGSGHWQQPKWGMGHEPRVPALEDRGRHFGPPRRNAPAQSAEEHEPLAIENGPDDDGGDGAVAPDDFTDDEAVLKEAMKDTKAVKAVAAKAAAIVAAEAALAKAHAPAKKQKNKVSGWRLHAKTVAGNTNYPDGPDPVLLMPKASAAPKAGKAPASSKAAPAGSLLVAKAAAVAMIHSAGALPRMPTGAKPECFVYRDARIYTSLTRMAYRCVLNPKQNPSDKPFSFKGFGSQVLAWQACLSWVNAERDAGR